MAKITVQHDGNPIEVELPPDVLTMPEVEAGYMKKDSFENALEARVRIRTKDMVNADEQRATLAQDETFLQSVADSNGEFFRKALEIKAPEGGDVDDLRKKLGVQIRDAEVKPLLVENEALKMSVGTMRGKELSGIVATEAVRLDVHKDNIELLQEWYRSKVGYDSEFDGWFVKAAGQGFELSTDPEGRVPHQTVGQHLEKLKAAGSHAHWFKSTTRAGSDFKGAGDVGNAGTLDEQIAAAEGANNFVEAQRLKVMKARVVGAGHSIPTG